jgi:hypothetical protein
MHGCAANTFASLIKWLFTHESRSTPLGHGCRCKHSTPLFLLWKEWFLGCVPWLEWQRKLDSWQAVMKVCPMRLLNLPLALRLDGGQRVVSILSFGIALTSGAAHGDPNTEFSAAVGDGILERLAVAGRVIAAFRLAVAPSLEGCAVAGPNRDMLQVHT